MGGGCAASVEGVFLCVADRTTGECGKFQSIVGGGGGGGCTCDNEGRQRTGQSASGEQLLRRQPSKK